MALTASEAVPENVAQTAAVPFAAPTVPEPGQVVFLEDFQNVSAGQASAFTSQTTGNRPAYVTAFPGYEGHSYTGASGWINAFRCNGVIVSASSATAPSWATTGGTGAPTVACYTTTGVQSWSFVRLLALAMGQQFGGGAGNFVYTSYTECNHNPDSCPAALGTGATDGVMWQTTTSIPLPAPNRYVTFGVDMASFCYSDAPSPQYQFAYQVPGSGNWTTLGTPINACSTTQDSNTQHSQRTYSLTNAATGISPWTGFSGTKTVSLNSVSATEAVRLAGGLIDAKLYNTVAATLGNDGSFDNVRVIDVTPRLDKAFSPAVILDGETSTLQFTITNTDDLDAKTGWSFTDQLPDGLFATGTSSTTCLGSSGTAGSLATVMAAAGSGQVVVQGSLADGQASCRVEVQVKAWNAQAGTGVGVYTNGPDNFVPGPGTPACWDGQSYGLCGLDAPEDATLTVQPVVDLSISKRVSSEQYTAGDQLTYTLIVANAASTSERPISIAKEVLVSDPVPARVTDPTWTCTGTGGATCGVASGSGDVADSVTIPPGGAVIYVVTGTVSTGDVLLDDITNVARATPPGEMSYPPTPGGAGEEISFPVTDPNCPPTAGCEAAVTSLRADLTVTKSADPAPGTALGRGQTVTYTLTFDHEGSTAATVDVTDDLRGVLDDADFGSLIDDGGLTVTGPTDGLLRVTGSISADTTVVYTVVVKDSGRSDNLLRNIVVLGPDAPPDDTCLPGWCTDHPVRYLYVEKVGTGGTGRLDGAVFVLRLDEGGVPGAVLLTPSLDAVPGETGLFITGGIAQGSYWLEEQRAPEGFQLLASAVHIEVTEDSAVTLTDPVAHQGSVTVLTADDGMSMISVADRRAFDLPLTGGVRAPIFWLSGGLLLAGAAALLVIRRRITSAPHRPTREARM